MSRPELTLTLPATGTPHGIDFIATHIVWTIDVLPDRKPRAHVTVRGKDDQLEPAGTTRFVPVGRVDGWWSMVWPRGLKPPVWFLIAADEFLSEAAPLAVAS